MTLNPTFTPPRNLPVAAKAGGGFESVGVASEGSATLLFSEDFESTVSSDITFSSGAQVVSSNPYVGTKCARVNLKSGANDPLLTANGLNSMTVEYDGDVLAVNNPTVRTIRWRVRWDDCTWNGTNFNQSSPINMKGGYFGPSGFKVQKGFYTVLNGNGGINFGDNAANNRGDSGWQNESWAEGRTLFYLNTGGTYGPGTGWHEFKMVVDASHPDYNQVKLFMDDLIATNGTYAPDGIIRVPKTWNVEQFSTSYTNADIVDLSTDGTETACGIQFDGIEIYEGEL